MKTVYFGGPIDGVSPAWAQQWRRIARQELEAAGFKVFDPTDGKDLCTPGVNDNIYTPDEIVTADIAAIDQSDILLVDWRRLPFWRRVWNFITTGHSDPLRVGTIMEIRHAETQGIDVLLFGNMRLGYWMRYHAILCFESLEQALNSLKEWTE